MSNVADDFEAIARRLKELVSEEPTNTTDRTPSCPKCHDNGWVTSQVSSRGWEECIMCGNPHKIPQPGIDVPSTLYTDLAFRWSSEQSKRCG